MKYPDDSFSWNSWVENIFLHDGCTLGDFNPAGELGHLGVVFQEIQRRGYIWCLDRSSDDEYGFYAHKTIGSCVSCHRSKTESFSATSPLLCEAVLRVCYRMEMGEPDGS